MKNLWSWVGIIILVAVLGFGGYYGWQQRGTLEGLRNELGTLRNELADQNNSLQNQIGNSLDNIVSPLNNAVDNEIITPIDPTVGWKTYSNTALGFSFKYPNNWSNVIISKQSINAFFEKGTVYGSWTSSGPRYFDPANTFSFAVYSQDYQNGLGTVITKKINVNWSTAEVETNAGPGAGDVLLAKKLSSKAMLLITYNSPECSPMMGVSVVVPLNITNFPNLFIGIGKPEFYKDPIVDNYAKSIDANDPSTGDPCDLKPAYQQITDKIARGGYPVLDNYIETAQLIADSVKVS